VKLYLVRHGQTDWNAAGRVQGHTDIELNERGISESECLVERFATIPVKRIFSSDLIRCRYTAERLAEATGASLELREDLRERCMGEWEGKHFDDLRAHFAKLESLQNVMYADIAPDGGESLSHVRHRLQGFLSVLLKSPEDALVLTHGGICSAFLTLLLSAPPEVGKSFIFGNTAVTLLERLPTDVWRLHSYADTSHLKNIRTTHAATHGSR